MIPITCITYKQNKDRLKHVYENIVTKFKDINVFSAIDGKTNELEYYLGKRKVHDKLKDICYRGQIACLLSHLEVWKNMVENNIEEMIIIEDDCNICDNFCIKFTQIYSELPDDYSLLYLFVHPTSKRLNKKFILYSDHLYQGFSTYGTVGYLITLKLATELLEVFKEQIYTTVDDTMSYYLQKYNKKYFCVKNNLIETNGNMFFHQKKRTELGSIISETDPYKTAKAIPNFYIEDENYLYYPCCKIVNKQLVVDRNCEGIKVKKY